MKSLNHILISSLICIVLSTQCYSNTMKSTSPDNPSVWFNAEYIGNNQFMQTMSSVSLDSNCSGYFAIIKDERNEIQYETTDCEIGKSYEINGYCIKSCHSSIPCSSQFLYTFGNNSSLQSMDISLTDTSKTVIELTRMKKDAKPGEVSSNAKREKKVENVFQTIGMIAFIPVGLILILVFLGLMGESEKNKGAPVLGNT